MSEVICTCHCGGSMFYWWRWQALGYAEEVCRVEVFNNEPWTKRGYRLLGGEWQGPITPHDQEAG